MRRFPYFWATIAFWCLVGVVNHALGVALAAPLPPVEIIEPALLKGDRLAMAPPVVDIEVMREARELAVEAYFHAVPTVHQESEHRQETAAVEPHRAEHAGAGSIAGRGHQSGERRHKKRHKIEAT
jgi:hypothetical protein